jgi:N-succinyldiaminopimelate aminotransferase
MPNPFYQIYEGAAVLAGAEPVFLDCDAAAGYLPDLDAVPTAIWRRCLEPGCRWSSSTR